MVKRIRVTCAIILEEGKVLSAQRSEVMALPLKWEFPGGKIEENESPEECLIREIKEELNLEIEIIERFQSNIHSYSPEKEIELIPFLCRSLGGNLVLKEHLNVVWEDVGNLKLLDWAEADIPILNFFIEWFYHKGLC
ncbi:(deoxy)nucleoside triphosphate pyrophosphohydrolase [Shivajiella indica]|uniref:8-oxo-dGTP diphosphatase n=1 Tax=Shivajiella indica TaxID=872115 RepID=A0ABW5BBG9_9BACT